MAQRRGRPSRDDYVRLVASMVRADLWKLNDCLTFATYPGVRSLVARHQREILPMGVALKLLIERAVTDVLALSQIVTTHEVSRIATFLQMWYVEGKPVTAVAKALQLERTHVAKTVQRPALELVARRFLALAEQVDPIG
jgi:hypothetical protein